MIWRASRKPAHDMPAGPQQHSNCSRTKTKKCAPEAFTFVWTTDRWRPQRTKRTADISIDDHPSNPSRGLGQEAWDQSSSLSIPRSFESNADLAKVLSELLCLGSTLTGSNPTNPSNTINTHMAEVQRAKYHASWHGFPPDDARRWLTFGFVRLPIFEK